MILFLTFTLLAVFLGSCVTTKEAEITNHNEEDFSEKPASAEPTDLHSSLLPTLEVTLDSCHVFLQPKKKSPYFGPLVKGEKIKKLDTHGSWVLVWIPRLRISGWVRGGKVQETEETASSPVSIPENLLSTVTVLPNRANIRELPTTRSRIIIVAERNQVFWLLNEKKGWFQIWLPDLKKRGWISGKIAAKGPKK